MMKKINLYFPEILFTANAMVNVESTSVELETQKMLNAELLRICHLQKKLLDEQSGMIVEMLEGMGKDS